MITLAWWAGGLTVLAVIAVLVVPCLLPRR
jgi:hypothetical protein